MSSTRYGLIEAYASPSCALILAASLLVGCGGDGAPGNASTDPRTPANDASSGDGTKHDSGAPNGSDTGDDATPGDDDGGATPHDDASATSDGGLDTSVAPGGNFDLSVWELQEPFGSPGAPTTIPATQLMGPKGFTDKYFFTDPKDGAMTFFDPENGVTTPNSNYPRCELREMTKSGAAANWLPPGNHTLSATVKATVIPDHVAVGQIHLGTGTPASTKPLLELFYYASGKIEMAIEQTPAGNNEKPYTVGNVPLGTPWTYVIGLSGNTISVVINGGTAQTWPMSSTFDQEGMYFKAGNYDQSAGSDGSVAATVQFYALAISHSN